MADLFAEQLRALRAQSLHRQLREIGSAQGATVDLADGRVRPTGGLVGKRLANFSSNDYLGLANDERLRAAAAAAIAQFGVGAGASRLISGTQSPHLQLEDALAKWKRTEAALCFSSGYATALGTIPALVGKHDVVLLDKLAHASLIDGARLSGATQRVFPHNHLGKLESHLQWAKREHPAARILIVTESVFSMDGDRAPLRELVDLKKRFDALLLLDEAHAVGVIGKNGRGLAAAENVSPDVDVQMGTLSKALGVSGGYICGSRDLIEWLINRARAFIFSTAPPPAFAAAAHAAVKFLESEEGEERRQTLWARIKKFRDAAGQDRDTRGEQSIADAMKTGSAIHPWIVGDEQAALDFARALQRDGFLVPAIRYPTVAKHSARLRVVITAAHSEGQIEALGARLRELNPKIDSRSYGVREDAQ